MKTARRDGDQIVVEVKLAEQDGQNWRKGGLKRGDIPGDPSAPRLS